MFRSNRFIIFEIVEATENVWKPAQQPKAQFGLTHKTFCYGEIFFESTLKRHNNHLSNDSLLPQAFMESQTSLSSQIKEAGYFSLLTMVAYFISLILTASSLQKIHFM